MHVVSKILASIVALIHVYILILEMFLWEMRGPDAFSSFPPELFSQTTSMAANQGLYNGFLAAGLIWALVFIRDQAWKRHVAVFFLGCVAIAGIFGAVTVSKTIFFIQALPAILGLVSLVALRK